MGIFQYQLSLSKTVHVLEKSEHLDLQLKSYSNKLEDICGFIVINPLSHRGPKKKGGNHDAVTQLPVRDELVSL